jgi:hypothetical protein
LELGLGHEAADGLDLLFTMERSWFAARRSITRRRKTSYAAAAVDVLAAAPVISATSLARILGITESIRISGVGVSRPHCWANSTEVAQAAAARTPQRS